jgi:hypothetical protein
MTDTPISDEEKRDNEARERREQGARLKQVREKAGFRDAAEAARSLGVPVPTYHAHENGERGMHKNMTLYADHFGVSVHWLQFGEVREAAAAPTPPVYARVAGLISEGMAVNPVTWKPPRVQDVPINPAFLENQQSAFLVSGDTAGDFAPDGTFVVCVAYKDVRRGFKNDDLVVIEVRHGELVERVIRRIKCPPGAECVAEHPITGAREVLKNGGAAGQMWLITAKFQPVTTS